MWVGRLVSMIEEHADTLAADAALRIREDPRTAAYQRLGEPEVVDRARDVYAHLGSWLGAGAEHRVEEEYRFLGRRRRAEGIPLAQVVMALLLVRRTLWQYVESHPADTVLELRQHYDLEILVVRFFDRAVYHTVRGYEDAR